MKNDIILHKDYAEIVLWRNNSFVGKVEVDLDDLEELKKYKWFCDLNDNIYSNTKFFGKNIKMHRLILSNFDKMTYYKNRHIYHKNREKFDKRRNNLTQNINEVEELTRI